MDVVLVCVDLLFLPCWYWGSCPLFVAALQNIIYLRKKYNITVAILAQGTSWAVALAQAFY